jgi:hypothetical protein
VRQNRIAPQSPQTEVRDLEVAVCLPEAKKVAQVVHVTAVVKEVQLDLFSTGGIGRVEDNQSSFGLPEWNVTASDEVDRGAVSRRLHRFDPVPWSWRQRSRARQGISGAFGDVVAASGGAL